MKINKRFAIMLVLLPILSLCQNQQFPSPPIQQGQQDYGEEVRKRQYASRDQNKMNYNNVQSYTIQSTGVDSFYIQPTHDQEVKMELYIYWKEGNIFISSEYRQGEQVRVIIYQDQQRIIYDNRFYMVNGFSFNAKKDSEYQIRFLNAGRIPKLISMTLSKMLQKKDNLLDSSSVTNTQNKISTIRSQIQAFYSISERNFIIQEKLNSQVLKFTSLYSSYQIIEVFLILIISGLQVWFITKILGTNSIV